MAFLRPAPTVNLGVFEALILIALHCFAADSGHETSLVA